MKRIFLIGLCVGINGVKSAEKAQIIPKIVITTPEQGIITLEEYELEQEVMAALKKQLSQLRTIKPTGKRSTLCEDGVSPFVTIEEGEETLEAQIAKDLKEHQAQIAKEEEIKRTREEEIKRFKRSFDDVWLNSALAAKGQRSASAYGPRIVNADGSRTISTHGSRSSSTNSLISSPTTSSVSTSEAASRPASTDAPRVKSTVFFLGSTTEEDEEA
ncbi:hypothetical protein K9K77_01110 [Candidatus Babeliales bacterium]|nr:hypothetical protein [Candidatus Babeliales bacterium]